MNLINKNRMDIFLEKKFFTLFDVIKLDLSHIAWLYECLCRAVNQSANEYNPVDYPAFQEEKSVWYNDLGYECESLNLIFTRKQLKRFKESLVALDPSLNEKLHQHRVQEYRSQITALKNILEDELRLQIAYTLSTEYQQFLRNCFNPETVREFQDLQTDESLPVKLKLYLRDVDFEYNMTEACKCIAFERWTASVFHLMRIVEGVTKALGAKLGIEKIWYGSWEAIIREFQKHIDSKGDKAPTREIYVLKEILLSFERVKDAWRNPTMHMEKKYTPEEVIEIFHATDWYITKVAKELR